MVNAIYLLQGRTEGKVGNLLKKCTPDFNLFPLDVIILFVIYHFNKDFVRDNANNRLKSQIGHQFFTR